jgi:hypothetical protein
MYDEPSCMQSDLNFLFFFAPIHFDQRLELVQCQMKFIHA